MRTVSDMIAGSKAPESNGVLVISAFLFLVASALGIPLALIWMASAQ